MNDPKPPATAKTLAGESSLVEWFMDDFVPRYGKQSLYALAVIAVAVAAVAFYRNSREARQAKENKELGRAYVYYDRGNLDSTEAMLRSFIKAGHTRVVQDKANLLLGQVNYDRQKYDEAIQAFGAVEVGTSRPLISSGALHGLASAYIQKKDFTKGAELLETFISKFMRKTGAPSEKVAGKEVADLSPTVPNALWKLALCYRELKNPEKAKTTAEKLVKVYPDTRESMDAAKLLQTLP